MSIDYADSPYKEGLITDISTAYEDLDDAIGLARDDEGVVDFDALPHDLLTRIAFASRFLSEAFDATARVAEYVAEKRAAQQPSL